MKIPIQSQSIIRNDTVSSRIVGGLVAPARKCRRRCEAYFRVTPLREGSRSASIGFFSSRGGCGCIVPNRCRRRARDRAHKCMADHFLSSGSLPESCQHTSISGYPFRLPPTSIRQGICRNLIDKSSPVLVHRVTRGKTGCSKVRFLGQFSCP